MKRLILADTQYEALRKIRDAYNDRAKEYDLNSEARINKLHHCVDIFVDGKLTEQRYPDHNGKVPGYRNRYVYVGPNRGDYKQVTYLISQTDYRSDEPYIKVMK